MIRFSQIIEKESREAPKKRNYRKTEISLRKIGIFDQDVAAEKSRMMSEAVNEGTAYYKRLYKLADMVREWVENDQVINMSAITPVMQDIVKKDLIGGVYHYLTFKGEEDEVLPSHSIRVTLLALKTGVGMGYADERLADLGTAAFLHDIGRYKVPEDVPDNRGTLSNQGFKEIQDHPEISADILSGLNDNYGWLSGVALQVHERADGSGYPFGLKQEEIHEYAFIIGLADMYVHMINDRPSRETMEANAAIREILRTAQQAFPAEVVKAFVNQVSFFPLGSYVKLNDRSIGRVVDTNPEYPLKPTVEVGSDGLGGKETNPRIVDLSQQILLYITGSIDETEIP